MTNSCQRCVFRLNDEGGVQTGCGAGQLPLYEALGLPVRKDDHFVIPGRMCRYNVHENAVPVDADLGELTDRIAKAMKVRVRWLVAAGSRMPDPDAVAAAAVAGASQAGVRETRAVVGDRKAQRKVSAALSQADVGRPWGVRWMTDATAADDPFMCLAEDLKADPTDCHFAFLVWSDAVPPPDVLADLDDRVNRQMEQVLYEDYPYGALVNTRVFLVVGHSHEDPFPARLERAIEETRQPVGGVGDEPVQEADPQEDASVV